MREVAVFAVFAVLGACSDAPGQGGSCTSDAECPSGAECLAVGAAGLRLCLTPCDPSLTVHCTEETEGSLGVCVGLEEGGACYPGGDVEVGESCEATSECALGALCVLDGEGGRCRLACDVDEPVCPAGATCSSLGAGIRGFCAPAP